MPLANQPSLHPKRPSVLPYGQSIIIVRLREYEAELKAAGVEHLVLHGSYARGTAIREGSDVDVIADFDRNRKQSLIGRVHLGNRLTDILGVKAGLCDRNLCDRKMLRPEVLSGARVGSCLLVRPRNAGRPAAAQSGGAARTESAAGYMIVCP